MLFIICMVFYSLYYMHCFLRIPCHPLQCWYIDCNNKVQTNQLADYSGNIEGGLGIYLDQLNLLASLSPATTSAGAGAKEAIIYMSFFFVSNNKYTTKR